MEEPKYLKVENYIMSLIENMEPGDMLPTEVELEKSLGVSRTTIRSAISILQNKGYITKQQGRGTFVAAHPYEEELSRLQGFTEDAMKKGQKTRAVVISCEVVLPDETMMQELKVGEKDEILKLNRVRYLDEEPVQVSVSYLPVNEIKAMDWKNIDFSEASLYESLEAAGVVIATAEECIEVDIASPLDAMLLNVREGFPMFVSNRIVCNDKGTPIEKVMSRTRGDKHKAHIKLKR